jgi:glucose-fructose oxidoreductase
VRWAVVGGPGYFAQAAVLPAFAHARSTSELTALVSDDAAGADGWASQYRVRQLLGYDQTTSSMASGAVDAVYIRLPNHLHKDYTVRVGARAGVTCCAKSPWL